MIPLHAYRSRTALDADLERAAATASELTRLQLRASVARDALEAVREYLDGKADADQPSGCAPQPNEEMRLLMQVEEALRALGGQP